MSLISYAEAHDLPLSTALDGAVEAGFYVGGYADPTDDNGADLSIAVARILIEEDPGLLYLWRP